MITLEEFDDHLLITLTEDGREELQEMIDKEGYTDESSSLLDSAGYLGNGWDCLLDRLPLYGGPSIGKGVSTDDQGDLEGVEEVYYFNNYCMESWKQTLLEKGSVKFDKL